MYVKLSVPERLKDLRVAKGLTLEELAEETGLSKSALGRYEADKGGDISPFAIIELSKFYEVSTDYLLGVTETKNHPNTELHELHLSDDMIALLKSGTVNNRLLCEIATHEGFRRLMVDAEIYIDRIADMRINDLNVVLAAMRRKVMEEQSPGEDDLYMRTLELTQVQEDEYFSHVVAGDIAVILKDIREKHRADTTTADTASPAADIQNKLQEVMNYEGSDSEKKVRTLLATLGISYDKLTKEQFITLIDILTLSDHLKSPSSQRGRGRPQMTHGKGKRKKRK